MKSKYRFIYEMYDEIITTDDKPLFEKEFIAETEKEADKMCFEYCKEHKLFRNLKKVIEV